MIKVNGPAGLIVYQSGHYECVGGLEEPLKELGRWAAWAASQKDTVVWIRLRQNDLPAWLRPHSTETKSLDIVLTPFHLAITPHGWKSIRSRKAWRKVSVELPFELDDSQIFPLSYDEFDWRGMDIRVGVSTLFFAGDPATFEGLAGRIYSVSGYEGAHAHLDNVARKRDHGTIIQVLEAAMLDPSQ